MMLGQMATPGAVELAGWLGCLFFLCAGANQVAKLWDRTRPRPPSSDLKGAIDLLSGRIAELEKSAAHNTARRKEIYEKIEETREGLTAQVERVHARVDKLQEEMHEQIKDLPNELVVLLRNTGAIHPK